MRRLFTSLLCGVLLSSAVLTGCSGAPSAPAASEPVASEAGTDTPATAETENIEYLFWGNQSEINIILDTIKKFNAEQTAVQVKGTGIDPSVYFQKLSAYASSNTLPDIIQVAVDYGDAYTKKNIFEPLDEYINSDGVKELVADSMWDALSYQDKIYATPLQASAPMLVGNKKLFEEANLEFPTENWTEEEFRDAAVKLTNAEKKQYGIIYGGWIKSWPTALFGTDELHAYDWDAKTMNAEGNAAYEHILTLLIEDLMTGQKAAPPALSTKDIGGGFETGNYGMAMIGFWDLREIHKVVQDSFDWDVIPLPTNAEYGQWRTELYANALSVSAQSEHKEAAFSYLKWALTNEEVQTGSVGLPVNKEIAESEAFLSKFDTDEKQYNKKLALSALNNGVAWRNTGVISEINTNVINPEIEKLVLKPDSTDVATAVKNIQAEGQKLFDTTED